MHWNILAGALALVCAVSAKAADWPCWRGPQHNGISDETGWLDQWPPSGPVVAWRAQVGTGYSSMAVSQGRVYTLGNTDNIDTVYCLDAATGATVWSHSYTSALDNRDFDGGPTATPTVDGDRAFTLGRHGDLFCLDAASGRVVWSQNVAETTAAPAPGWGFAGSPVVDGQRLLLAVGETGAALDKRTGALIWKSAESEAGYAAPLVFERNGLTCALVASGRFWHCVRADTGEELWRHRWLTRFGCNAADAILSGDLVFISSGYNRGSALLRLTDGAPEVVWSTTDMQNQFSSSVLIDAHVYGIDGDTTGERRLKCLELSTGDILWSAEGIGSGALMAAGSRLIILSETGELVIAKASPAGFEPTARAKVLDGTCWTVPVLADGRIYARNTRGDMVCLDVRPDNTTDASKIR